ncbi:hypothetical protein IHC93_19945 [Photobacterium damselae subsp. damselae]|uniref:hypothetical protein n=1 Tax=Photobacterium damselae TaxID=38293 RepID=UPI001F2BB063|nr:hypothetical protein [Photobacterium damselae]UKA27198.1 hypothetical protein IHC93_19945 [Photobacterium damselae subsp. damselae]
MKMMKSIVSKVVKGIREIQCEFYKGDTVTLFDVSPWGVDSQPIKGARGVGDREGRFLIGWQNTSKKAKDGETRIYSTNENGDVVAEIYLTSQGEIKISKGKKLIIDIDTEFTCDSVTHNGVSIDNSHLHPISKPNITDEPQR